MLHDSFVSNYYERISLISSVYVSSMQGASVQSGGIGLRGLPHAY